MNRKKYRERRVQLNRPVQYGGNSNITGQWHAAAGNIAVSSSRRDSKVSGVTKLGALSGKSEQGLPTISLLGWREITSKSTLISKTLPPSEDYGKRSHRNKNGDSDRDCDRDASWLIFIAPTHKKSLRNSHHPHLPHIAPS